MSAQPRLVAGRFRTIRRLGAGAMASVFLAEDCELGRMVAIKRLHPDSPEDVAPRFRREMRVAASLSHPHIVTLFDAITDEDSVLLVMEYVEGPTLAERLHRGAFEPDAALDALWALADAVDHLHARGIIHRDIKPANVLLDTSGRVKLTDLGIASAAQATGITTTGSLLGTPAYMAPELFEGTPATPASDVYSLAAVAYEMLTGRRAREGGTPAAMALRAASEEGPDLGTLREDSPALAAVLQRGMARAPADRPASATALVDAIAGALERDAARAAVATAHAAPAPAPRRTEPAGAGTGAAPAAPAPRRGPGDGVRPTRGVLVAGLALACVVAAVAAVLLTGNGSERRAPPAARSTSANQDTTPATSGGARSASTATTPAATPSTATAAPTTSTSAPTTSTPAPGPATAATPETPEGAVQAFYGRAAAHSYAEAWSLAAPSLRRQLGGYDAFRSQFSSVRSIRFSRAQTVHQSAGSASVAIATTATHTDRVDHCSGTVRATRGGSGGWLVSRVAVGC